MRDPRLVRGFRLFAVAVYLLYSFFPQHAEGTRQLRISLTLSVVSGMIVIDNQGGCPKGKQMEIKLTNEQADKTISYLQALSDRLTKEHEESYSGVDKLVLFSAIVNVDRLVVEIREQLEAQTIRPS